MTDEEFLEIVDQVTSAKYVNSVLLSEFIDLARRGHQLSKGKFGFSFDELKKFPRAKPRIIL